MTLDEAITHAREIAERGGECAEDHRQLAEWLEELRGIVRCRDCKFRCLDECTRIDEGFKDYWFAIELDGFCKWAEREAGGE